MKLHDSANFKKQQLRGGLRFHFDNKSQVRKHINDSLYYEFDPPQRKLNSLWEETCLAVEQICNKYEKPYKIAYSGGLDSEYVVKAFLEVAPRDSFELWHMQVCKESSIDDEYVRRFEDEHNIKCKWVYFDWDDWVYDKMFQEFITKIIPYHNIFSGITPWLIMKMYEDKKGSVIYCHGNPIPFSGYATFTEATVRITLPVFMEWMNIPGTANFWWWSEELWYVQILALDEDKDDLENKRTRYKLPLRPAWRLLDHINNTDRDNNSARNITIKVLNTLPINMRNGKMRSLQFLHNIAPIKEFKSIINNPRTLYKKADLLYFRRQFEQAYVKLK